MKTKLIASIFWLALSLMPAFGFADNGSPEEIGVVITPQRILFLTDETPVASISVQVTDNKGKVVLEKQFTAKMVNWSLDVDQLPAGKYCLSINDKHNTCFSL